MKVLTGKFTGLYLGEVVDNVDPLNLNRVKVRVRGVYELPYKIEDIPYAYPIFISVKVLVGEEVFILFLNGDVRVPCYFPATLLSKSDYSVLCDYISKIKSSYEGILRDYRSDHFPDVVVSLSDIDLPKDNSSSYKSIFLFSSYFTERVSVSAGVFSNVKEYKVTEEDLGLMVELDRTVSNQKLGFYFPGKYLLQINGDGVYQYISGEYVNVCSGVWKVYGEKDFYIISSGKIIFHGAGGVFFSNCDLKWVENGVERYLLTDGFWDYTAEFLNDFVYRYNGLITFLEGVFGPAVGGFYVGNFFDVSSGISGGRKTKFL